MSTAHRVIKNLRQRISLAGCGCFSAVFSVKAGDKVIKVGSTTNDPWLDFYELVIKPNPNNPFVPKVYSVYIDSENDYYIATMEKLQENTSKLHELYKDYVTSWITPDDLVNQLKESKAGLSDEEISQLLDILDCVKQHTDYFRGTTEPGFYTDDTDDPADYIRSLDMHAGNFMMRDNILVITDPWCLGDMESQDDLSDWVEHIKSK